MAGERDNVIQTLIDRGANVNALNSAHKTPLFAAVENNNPIAAATLLKNDADHELLNSKGLAAFDLIKDIDDWVRSEFFEPRFKEVIRAYEHKQIRHLIRSVSNKVKHDVSSKAVLIERSHVLDGYLNQHYAIFSYKKIISSISNFK